MNNDKILMEQYLKICNNNIITEGMINNLWKKLTGYFTCFSGLSDLSNQLSTGQIKGDMNLFVDQSKSAINNITSKYSFLQSPTKKLQQLGYNKLGNAFKGPINTMKKGGDLNTAAKKMTADLKNEFGNGVKNIFSSQTTVSQQKIINENINKFFKSSQYKKYDRYITKEFQKEFCNIIQEEVKYVKDKNSFYHNLKKDLFFITSESNINIINNNNKIIYEETFLNNNKKAIIYETKFLQNTIADSPTVLKIFKTIYGANGIGDLKDIGLLKMDNNGKDSQVIGIDENALLNDTKIPIDIRNAFKKYINRSDDSQNLSFQEYLQKHKTDLKIPFQKATYGYEDPKRGHIGGLFKTKAEADAAKADIEEINVKVLKHSAKSTSQQQNMQSKQNKQQQNIQTKQAIPEYTKKHFTNAKNRLNKMKVSKFNKNWGTDPNKKWYQNLWAIFKHLFVMVHNMFLWIAAKLIGIIMWIVKGVAKAAGLVAKWIFNGGADANSNSWTSKIQKWMEIKVDIHKGILNKDQHKISAVICQLIAIACWVGIGSLLIIVILPKKSSAADLTNTNNNISIKQKTDNATSKYASAFT